MIVRAQSLATGLCFPKSVSDEMAKLNFTSNLWISEKELELTEFKLMKRHIGNHLTCKINNSDTRLYNVSQTTRPEKLTKLLGRLRPQKLFSSDILSQSASRKLISSIISYEKNEWLTEGQLKYLGLKTRPNAKPIIINEASENPPCELKFYNIGELEEPHIIARMKTLLPISASTGCFYKMPEALRILRFAIHNNFESPFWLPVKLADELKLVIKKSCNPLVLTVPETGAELKLFNSAQTSSPKIVIAHALEQQFCPRSGVSGRRFPKIIEDVLSASSARNKFESVFWLKDAYLPALSTKLLPGQIPTTVACGNQKTAFYNVVQTDSRQTIEKRFHG